MSGWGDGDSPVQTQAAPPNRQPELCSCHISSLWATLRPHLTLCCIPGMLLPRQPTVFSPQVPALDPKPLTVHSHKLSRSSLLPAEPKRCHLHWDWVKEERAAFSSSPGNGNGRGGWEIPGVSNQNLECFFPWKKKIINGSLGLQLSYGMD